MTLWLYITLTLAQKGSKKSDIKFIWQTKQFLKNQNILTE